MTYKVLSSLTANNVNSADIDVKYAVTDNISVYMENDFDADFKQTATIVGGKISF